MISKHVNIDTHANVSCDPPFPGIEPLVQYMVDEDLATLTADYFQDGRTFFVLVTTVEIT